MSENILDSLDLAVKNLATKITKIYGANSEFTPEMVELFRVASMVRVSLETRREPVKVDPKMPIPETSPNGPSPIVSKQPEATAVKRE